jgi:hypothetical protein
MPLVMARAALSDVRGRARRAVPDPVRPGRHRRCTRRGGAPVDPNSLGTRCGRNLSGVERRSRSSRSRAAPAGEAGPTRSRSLASTAARTLTSRVAPAGTSVLRQRWRGRPLGWWSSAVARQGAANHREVRRSRAGVLSGRPLPGVDTERAGGAIGIAVDPGGTAGLRDDRAEVVSPKDPPAANGKAVDRRTRGGDKGDRTVGLVAAQNSGDRVLETLMVIGDR